MAPSHNSDFLKNSAVNIKIEN